MKHAAAAAKRAAVPEAPVPVVSVVRAEVSDFVATVFVDRLARGSRRDPGRA